MREIPGRVQDRSDELRRGPSLHARRRRAHRDQRHRYCGGDRSTEDRGFSDAVPGAHAVPVAHDTDIMGGRPGEGVVLELERLPAAVSGKDGRPDNSIERHLDVERRAASVAQVPGDVRVIDGREPAQVVADPLTIPLRRPAGGKVVVARVLWDGALTRARHD